MSWSFEDTNVGRYLISLRKRKPEVVVPKIVEDKILENPCYGLENYGNIDFDYNLEE